MVLTPKPVMCSFVTHPRGSPSGTKLPDISARSFFLRAWSSISFFLASSLSLIDSSCDKVADSKVSSWRSFSLFCIILSIWLLNSLASSLISGSLSLVDFTKAANDFSKVLWGYSNNKWFWHISPQTFCLSSGISILCFRGLWFFDLLQELDLWSQFHLFFFLLGRGLSLRGGKRFLFSGRERFVYNIRESCWEWRPWCWWLGCSTL